MSTERDSGKKPSVLVTYAGRQYMIRSGWDVYVLRRSSRGEHHWARVPHTHARILEAVRGDVSAAHILSNPGRYC